MRKNKAEAKLDRAIRNGRQFTSMYQRRTTPNKWVVRSDYATCKTAKGKQISVPTYVVVGVNHAGYMATVALRTRDRPAAARAASLLNKRIADQQRKSA